MKRVFLRFFLFFLICLLLPTAALLPDAAAPAAVPAVTALTEPDSDQLYRALLYCAPQKAETDTLIALGILLHSHLHADPETPLPQATENNLFVFRSYAEKRRIREAAETAADFLLCYEDRPMPAVFHAVSNGRTEDAAEVFEDLIPGVVSVSSEGDSFADEFEKTFYFSEKELKELLLSAFPDADFAKDPTRWLLPVEKTAAGYLKTAEAGGVLVSGTALSNALSLPGRDLTFSYERHRFAVTVCGKGHGAGLSLAGADYYAGKGMNYAAILSHYFPDCTIKKAE